MSGSVDIYTGELWTRPEFLSAQPIPEPETYAMMLVGIGLIGWQLRRKGFRVAKCHVS